MRSAEVGAVDAQSAPSSGNSLRDQDARAAIAAGFDQWEAHLLDGLTRMKIEGKLSKEADPATLATATLASIQGELLLTQVHRDPCQLRIALDAARSNLYLAKS
jgi:hypothetical protein